MTFDPKCFDLARSFLSDNPELDAEKLAPILAAHIQETVEDFIAGEQVSSEAFDMNFWTQMRPKKAREVKNV